MIKSEYDDYQRKTLKKWHEKKYFLKEIHLINIFNWKNATLRFNSPISLITGKNGIGKSTFINALKQVYNLQNKEYEFGILFRVKNYKIRLLNHKNNELIVENQEIVKQDFSLPNLIDLTFNSKLYAYYKNSTGLNMMFYLATLKQYDAKPLPSKLLTIMKELIGKQIISAERIIDQEPSYPGFDLEPSEPDFDLEPPEPDFDLEPPEPDFIQEKPYLEYYRIKLVDGTVYDSYTMGSGEFYINQFLWGLDSLTENSIVIIEELENFLHSEAQKKILELIHEYSLKKNVQFILTTHSPTLIEHTNNYSRILLKIDSESNISCVNNCSEGLAKDSLGANIENKIEVLVEDEKALHLFRTIISQKNSNLLKQLIINNCGGDANIKKYIDINKSLKIKSSKIIGVVDGDSPIKEEEYLIKFPGEKPPEKLIMEYITANYETVVEKIERPLIEVKTAFENAKTLSDYHEWFSYASSNLGEDNDVLWIFMTKMWCKENSKEIDAFYTKFEEQFNKLSKYKYSQVAVL
ncbi:AAA domain, putative AbiEii toxin, Type IV TA system [uncultured archaeon]|nr:AAA domain, putative AbiEii toxin, Type IV TA system [uncultured archaeon]